ncbi:uncharacterized protein LOC133867238 [Alnus glutinosa]|uniref:uncharacterized protein LOC133867238 n=1 Tax=Alnus glutinosa TaxID=3517 RepID=UPI002D79922F|nr:uncharacterized protein LOC133867238 [Alnus glutinosa]
MRPYLAVSLLLLCLLLSEAQGIRLDKMFMSSLGQQKQQEADGNALITKSIDLCKDGHCSGKNRKLINTASTTTTTTTTTTSKNEKNEEKENFSVNGKPTSEHHEIGHDHFPADITDITEMDYSPAKRKPPIHN